MAFIQLFRLIELLAVVCYYSSTQSLLTLTLLILSGDVVDSHGWGCLSLISNVGG